MTRLLITQKNGQRSSYWLTWITCLSCDDRSFFNGFILPQLPGKLQIRFRFNNNMPLFFLLSGFGLSVRYVKTLWKGSTKRCLGSSGVEYSESAGENRKIFDTWEFYKNRLIRILPVHYLGIAAGLMQWSLRQYDFTEDVAIGSIISMFAVSTWVLPYHSFQPNGPS